MNANDSEDSRKRMVCFLSSPFTEPIGVDWPARRNLYKRLRDVGYTPWLYDEEGEREFAITGKDPKEIITRAIQSADVVVMFFKTRAGSYFPQGPFRGTDYEYWEARRLGKPIYLYLIGRVREPSLTAMLSIISDPLLLLRSVTVLETEGDEFIEAVRSDLEREVKRRSAVQRVDSFGKNEPGAELDGSWLERKLEVLQNFGRTEDLWAAAKEVQRIPILSVSKIDPNLKRLYASVWTYVAGFSATTSPTTKR